MIEPLHDAAERVWLDPTDLTNDGSDAKWGVVLHHIGKDEYEDNYPDGKMKSLSTGAWNNAYYYKPDFITIGHAYFIEEEEDQLYQMTDGRVLRASQTPENILDDLELAGIQIEDTRDVKRKVCKLRMFDAGGWLTDAQDTVFDCVPIVPVYGNFTVVEGKILYRGVVEKLMDMQRVHNYAFSRNVEEVALSPRKKIFMTPEQAEGHEESIASMNTNMNPVQFYNATGDAPPPYEGGASQPNQAVTMLTEQSDQAISKAAGLFAANMGANTQLQSGVAIEKQIDRGNNGTSVYFSAMKTAITRTGKIILKAIPIVYDATRQIRILKEDGTIDQFIANNVVVDAQTGEKYTLNDLTRGKYDVVCDIGAAYKNRQQEASEMFMRAMEKDPQLVGVAGDIWVRNINAPGFDKIAERLRMLALNNGMIPMEQMTEQERAAEEAKQAQPPQPSLEQMQLEIAQMQAQTQQMREQNIGQQHELEMMKIQAGMQGDKEKLQSKLAVDSAKIQQTQERIDMERVRVEMDAQKQQFDQMIDMQKQQFERLNTLTSALMNIKNAIGADAIVSEQAVNAYEQTAEDINDGEM
jgi:hypothetical protein